MRTGKAVLDILGIDYIERPGRSAFCCPFHNDTDPSAGFYDDTNLAHCYSCAYTLNPTQFYARYHGIGWEQADRELFRLTGEELPAKYKVPELKLKRTLAPMERRLESERPNLGRADHVYFGELTDLIWWNAERGFLDEKTLDTLALKWYNDLEEALSDARPKCDRAPRTSPDVWLAKGVGQVSGAGREDGLVDLD